MDISLLKKIGFSDKSAKVYLALLRLGPSSVRMLASETGLNRGTTYDCLKWLQEEKLVTFFKQDSKQQFVAESPDRLQALIRERQDDLVRTEHALGQVIAELDALRHSGNTRPVARYYTADAFPDMLEDMLALTEASEDRQYRVYSTEGIREYLYKDFPTFSDVRVARGIHVRVIAIGNGGELRGLDERKWLHPHTSAGMPVTNVPLPSPTYIMIYPGNTAYISLDHTGAPMGVVIENPGVASMQQTIFDALWQTLSCPV